MPDSPQSDHPPATGIGRRAFAGAGLVAIAAAGMPATAAPARARRPKVEDRLAIEDLFTSYLWAFDCGDADAFATLFTAGAVVVGKGTRYAGRAAILEWFRMLIGLRDREGDDAWMHQAGQFRFVPADGGWIVFAYATHFNGNSQKGTRGVRSLGYFTCECRREAGEWKFHRFSISAWDRTAVPWKKPLPWAGG
ncbi:nuclear transport factor 2 family protein [Sphingomonas canadensis]|uniref:Nuclear transport factor 2 family protein n=1 Tax=Sphingomonas canadensis TaxID=1219257 RepID=A0ABW3H841_9SPHN|nr:nuclear transport factor 2 family protein [Sphingomonas canadensis]MCW3837008.1 nuclear transport factor 2 family protein [Sphingomonas canadensis]